MTTHNRRARLRHTAVLAALVCALSLPALAETPGAAPAAANRLITAASPYLLQHAHNPVDWYPWGEEALAKAKRENKPIFISIGYSTCYWCHVAERTIYANPQIATLMNQWFINIKVDREERPDLDRRYMLVRQMLTGSGGWPNNLFLTPDLKPFFAGSYFPPEDDHGAAGFPTILKSIHDTWTAEPRKITATGEQVVAGLARYDEKRTKSTAKQSVTPERRLATARDRALAERDEHSGGLGGGSGPKFPQSPMLHLLLTDYKINGTAASLATVTAALDAMALGGIHDQLGTGMHRYSTEPTWSVPHFEKMLYDNAQLLGLYADAYAITKKPLARAMAADLAGYLTTRMMAPDGGFYTAEDADIDGKEGETYLWTKEEIARVLGPADAEKLLAVYALTPLPDDPGGVLRIRLDRPPGDTLLSTLAALAPQRAKLLDVRNRRRQPARDDKIVIALNGLAIEALANAGMTLHEPTWIEAARHTGETLWQRAFEEKTGRLSHHLFNDRPSGEAFLDDSAALGLGFLALAKATGDPVWTTRARALAIALTARFIKPDGCIVTATASSGSALPAVDLDELETPSGTSAAYALLARLGETDAGLAKTASALLAGMVGRVDAAPSAWPSLIAFAAVSGRTLAAEADAALDSAAHVKIAARAVPGPDHDEVIVTLAIDPGFHVNANPATADYLVPTKVTLASLPDAEPVYPAGQIFRPKFSADALAVYEGATEIRLTVPKGQTSALTGVTVSAEVQACTEQICLAPATITAAIAK